MNRKSVLRNDAHNSIEQMCKQIYTCTYSHSDIRITRTLKDEDGRQELTESGHTEIKLERRKQKYPSLWIWDEDGQKKDKHYEKIQKM